MNKKAKKFDYVLAVIFVFLVIVILGIILILVFSIFIVNRIRFIIFFGVNDFFKIIFFRLFLVSV